MGDNRETNAINHFGFAHEALNLGVYPGAEPLRVCRRPFDLSHAAIAGSSSMA